MPQVKKPDVDVLGWRDYTRSVVVRPFGHTDKFREKLTFNYLATALVDSKQKFEPLIGYLVSIPYTYTCDHDHAYQLHDLSKLETSVVLYCVTKLHI
jgi:hypothetical protein